MTRCALSSPRRPSNWAQEATSEDPGLRRELHSRLSAPKPLGGRRVCQGAEEVRSAPSILGALAQPTLAQQFETPDASTAGAFVLAFFLVGLLLAVLMIWGIFDAAGGPESSWRSADQNKVAWILVQAILPILGSIVYLLWIRPKIRSAGRNVGRATSPKRDSRCP